MDDQPTRTLASGAEMPVLGLGVWQMATGTETERAVDDPTIHEVAERVGRTPAQVMLRWAIQHQAVVIPKSSNQERIRSNAQVFDFELGADDMRVLDALDRTNGSADARG